MSFPRTPNPDENTPKQSAALQGHRLPRSVGRRELLEDKLKRLQTEIADRLQAIAERKKVETRQKEARLDRLIGAACRADISVHEGIKAALKSVKAPADREFLKIEGWL